MKIVCEFSSTQEIKDFIALFTEKREIKIVPGISQEKKQELEGKYTMKPDPNRRKPGRQPGSKNKPKLKPTETPPADLKKAKSESELDKKIDLAWQSGAIQHRVQ